MHRDVCVFELTITKTVTEMLTNHVSTDAASQSVNDCRCNADMQAVCFNTVERAGQSMLLPIVVCM